MKLQILIAVLIVLATIPTAGMAVRVEIPPSEDTYVSSADPTTDFSTAAILPVHDFFTTVRALMKFDLSPIPADADINLAYLYVYDGNGPTTDSPVYETTSGWIDNLVNWNNRPSYNATAVGKLDGYATEGWFYADLTELVRQWHNGTKSNNGVTIGGGLLTIGGYVQRNFHSVENATNPPKLVVIYDSDSVRITPSQDTYVSYDDPTGNYGASDSLQIRKYGRWSYLQFDVGSVPAGATIDYARLRMYEYYGSNVSTDGYPVGAHLISEAWEENSLTWEDTLDYYPSPPYVKGPVGFSTQLGWIDLNVTSYVQDWYDWSPSNNGVLVKYPLDDGMSSSGGVGSFRSREYGTLDQRPVLEVYYTAPPANTFGTPASLTAVSKSEAVWGDWDDDGDLDLVYCGDTGAGYVTLTYENVNGVLTERANSITGIVKEFAPGGLAFGDYDNDGDLDLAVAGQSGSGPFTGIYENDGHGNFTLDTSQSLLQLRYASLAWGDYDGDGDLDLYAQGHTGSDKVSVLYENDPDATPRLQDSGIVLSQIYAGSAVWVDWDNDCDLDLAVTGSNYLNRFTIFYENTGSSLTAVSNGGLPNIIYGDLEWGDYDNDGDMDLAFMGEIMDSLITYGRVYQNDGDGNLTQVWSANQGFRLGTCAWGDYDNDGKLDLAFCGYDTVGVIGTHIYHNDGVSGFSRHTASLQDVYYGSVSWADVDSDGDLDLFVTGGDVPGNRYAELYPNQNGVANTPPTAPNSFTTIRRKPWVPLADRKLYLQWAGASDAETTNRGLYYCVRVGTSPGANDVFSGTYGSPLLGNVAQSNSLEITIPSPEEHYYWAVRTIDSGLMASAWSVQQCSWAPDSLESRDMDPDDDAFVSTKDPNETYGTEPTEAPDRLIVGDYAGGGSGSLSRTYFKFNLSESFLDSMRIERAELQLSCLDVQPTPGYKVGVYGLNDIPVWTEGTITWYSACTAFYYYASDVAEVSAGLCTWDVTKLVKAGVGHDVTFVLKAVDPSEGAANVAEFASKEYWDHDLWPVLHLTYAVATGVDDAPILETLILGQNYPNPFNPQTRVSYTVPDGSRAPVSIRIYDVAGRLVRSLVDEPQSAGVYTIDWDGTNDRGTRVASGVYFYQLKWKGEAQTKKMILLK